MKFFWILSLIFLGFQISIQSAEFDTGYYFKELRKSIVNQNSQFLENLKNVEKPLLSKVVNVQNKENGNTPLMVAARQGWKEGVIRLLGLGANTKIKNNNGKTAYDIAMTQANNSTGLEKQNYIEIANKLK